jgi:hypothetical protein
MKSLDITTLLPELRLLVTDLSEDLLARVNTNPEINAGLNDAFKQIKKGGRTGQAYEVWLEDYLDQVAVAWVLACVFIRFMEDNELIGECWLAGEGDRRKLAEDTHELFFREHAHETDREYFQHVFKEVGQIPAAKHLFAEGKTPLWAVTPSGDAAMNLLKFWREMVADTGHLKRSFKVESGDTRFLGDLYQELSERAKKKFALLQTPVFVEEFILDRTLTPALAEFGLEKVRMIDPTCGSGHFLLGGFARLFNLWSKPDHTTGNAETDAQKALDGVWGVDINPFAVAIARFRLIVAALQACGIKRLKRAPGWNIHLASGDSLLFGPRWNRNGEIEDEQGWLATDEGSWAPDIYACEDREAIQGILGQRYHVVVGNPPYITESDKQLNAAYRKRWSTCYQQFSLAVPFLQRFFDLTAHPTTVAAGYIGTITASSFTKREFGKRLVETFLPAIDLTHVIDTSGAYIPGHGTPTVILLGRNRAPQLATIRVVAGIQGEPSTPVDPSQGEVWTSILRQVDAAGSRDEFISTDDVQRTVLYQHPWTLRGGGVSEAKRLIASNVKKTLGEYSNSIGRTNVVGEDECWLMDVPMAKRHGLLECTRPFAVGDRIRDWQLQELPLVIYPYQGLGGPVLSSLPKPALIWLWPFRPLLEKRKVFGNLMSEQGKQWYEHLEHYTSKFRSAHAIVFSFVATHNHFVFDTGGKLFNRSAPIIKLTEEYEPCGDTVFLGLLGCLNSSIACFWMKQTFHNMGSTVDQHGARQRTDPFEDFYQHMGTGLKECPLPDDLPRDLGRRATDIGMRLSVLSPQQGMLNRVATAESLRGDERAAELCIRQLIALQEEIDWHCYRLYGLLSDDLRYNDDPLPELSLGERAFEIVMARQIAKGALETTWFERHGSQPVIELPEHWPVAYRNLIDRRIKLIETNKEIGLIERPEYKRRWNTEPWAEQEQRALKNWLLDRLETSEYRRGTKDNPELTTAAQMADVASTDAEFQQVAALYRGRPDFDSASLVAELVESQAVPFLPVLRYKPVGLRKRKVWERTWDLQRQHDAGKDVGEVPVPPKYSTADFLKTDYWRLRGKLDVPKERWISFPHGSTESDPSLVVGWAGWTHLEQATAIIAYYDARKREGWDAKRLTPLLTGLDQLLPWIHHWHPEIDPEFGETAGQSFQTMLGHDAHELGLTMDDIRNWTPPEKTKAVRRKKEKA